MESRTAPALGYVSLPVEHRSDWPSLRDQAIAIERACIELGLELGHVTRDAEPVNGTAARPALRHALEQLAAGNAGALVVARLDCLAGSAAGLGAVVEWFGQHEARLVAADLGLDTATPAGLTAARALVAAGRLENSKLGERTRRGLAAARRKGGAVGRPAVIDKPELRERIRLLRAEGVTLQAIADRLNGDGVPTLRGGAEWRPSSVQAAAGYKRPGRNRRAPELPPAPSEASLSRESSRI
ncbi:MAG TPA: recombinase family protein [Thermoleophilaceae bacterium]|jgi:DNA invertase Pin-like site-specific DNA recombinase|nr:recombinase family protein [Thermoleophilaceae bacterium]